VASSGVFPEASVSVATLHPPPKAAFRADSTDATDMTDFTDTVLVILPDYLVQTWLLLSLLRAWLVSNGVCG
jgi:hypothetical protein